jgi:rhamnosyl/mannosyltransferase
MSKIKVLHVYRTYFPDPPGGVQEAIRQIVMSTKENGIESRVYSLSPEPSPRVYYEGECRVTRSRSWFAPASCDLGGLDSLRCFREEVEWADVVNLHFPWPFADLLYFLGSVKKPMVITYHSDIVKQRLLGAFYSPLMRKTLGSAKAVIATSPNYARTSAVLQNFLRPEQLKIIPLGIADYVGKVISDETEKSILEKFMISGKPYVLALGALRYYKGFHTLVEAAKNINANVVIAGSGVEEESLKKMATALDVKNLIFAGHVSEEQKVTLLRHCSLFALPSHLRSEAFGMVLVEALMFGKPLVSCEIGSGTSFVNVHDETGLVVSPNDPVLLADSINAILSNRNLAVEMGIAARQRYEHYFSGNALGKEYANIYRLV